MKKEYDKGYWKKLVILKTDQHWNSNSQNRASSNNTRDDSTHGHHQKVNTEIKLIIAFSAKDGEDLYDQQQQKKDWELSVIQIMSFLLLNSDLRIR